MFTPHAIMKEILFWPYLLWQGVAKQKQTLTTDEYKSLGGAKPYRNTPQGQRCTTMSDGYLRIRPVSYECVLKATRGDRCREVAVVGFFWWSHSLCAYRVQGACMSTSLDHSNNLAWNLRPKCLFSDKERNEKTQRPNVGKAQTLHTIADQHLNPRLWKVCKPPSCDWDPGRATQNGCELNSRMHICASANLDSCLFS